MWKIPSTSSRVRAVTEATDEPEGRPRLRADAERNRERIVVAAREVFRERGLHAPLEEVAARAGVGVATLYRRFPTRTGLITGVFEEKMHAYADSVDRALADPDPWHGFCRHVETVCEMQVEDRGLTDVLTMTFPADERFEAARSRAYAGFVELVSKAKATGRRRPDFSPEDLAMVLMANAGVVNATGSAAPRTWRRLVAYFLQAFAAEAARPLPDPPTPEEMHRAQLRIQRTALP
jgi:AcrR family transcriptional regulator